MDKVSSETMEQGKTYSIGSLPLFFSMYPLLRFKSRGPLCKPMPFYTFRSPILSGAVVLATGANAVQEYTFPQEDFTGNRTCPRIYG